MPPSGGAQKAGPFETLGAWLHVWTPPRDVEVPDVPVRKLVVIGVVGLIVIGVAAAIAIPKINSSKEHDSAREKAQQNAFLAARRKRFEHEQRAQFAAGKPATDSAGRKALIADLKNSVIADAQARVKAKELEGPIRDASCTATADSKIGGLPEDTPSKKTGVYDCVAVTDHIAASTLNVAGSVGYPFRGQIHFDTGKYAWCKTNPPPGERVVPDPRLAVTLPKACTG
jgi:hypothetical protein